MGKNDDLNSELFSVFKDYNKPEINKNNIIERYIRMVGGDRTNPDSKTFPGLTDAPAPFIRATAVFLVSTFMGRNFAMASMSKAKIFVKSSNREKNESSLLEFNDYMNLWFIILGKSRIGRKSVTMDFMQQVIQEISPELEISYNFTPQALIKNLAEEKCVERKDGRFETRFAWILDECTLYFNMLKKADFMASSDGLMSKFYDGKTFTESTIGRGKKIVKNPYCTAFLASTPILPKSFTEGLFRQGLLNRFLFCVSLTTNFKDERLDGILTDCEDEERYSIVDWFEVLNSIVLVTVLKFKSPAKKIYSEFNRKVDSIINKYNLGLREPYFGNLHNYLKRLSAVYQVSELSKEELLKIDGIMYITENSVLWAIQYLEKVWDDFNKVLELMVTSAEPKDVKTDKYIIQRIIVLIRNDGIINEKGNSEIKKYELRRKAQHYKDFDILLDEMINMQLIKENVKKSARGPPGIWIELVDDLDG